MSSEIHTRASTFTTILEQCLIALFSNVIRPAYSQPVPMPRQKLKNYLEPHSHTAGDKLRVPGLCSAVSCLEIVTSLSMFDLLIRRPDDCSIPNISSLPAAAPPFFCSSAEHPLSTSTCRTSCLRASSASSHIHHLISYSYLQPPKDRRAVQLSLHNLH